MFEMRRENRQMAEVTMRPVCECGHVFESLSFNTRNHSFTPYICPGCKRVIDTFRYDDLTKRRPDEDGDLCICE